MKFSKLFRFKDSIINRFDKEHRLVYVVETNDWIVKWVGKHVVGYLNESGAIKGRVSLSSDGLQNKIIHFGSINSYMKNGLKKDLSGNKIVATWFHVVPNDERLQHIDEMNRNVDLVLTSCQTTKANLIKAGLKAEKIAVVALGVDLNDFKVLSQDKKEELKKNFGLAPGKIIIGSFQKDGNGWGKGLEPKLIKGPDIFCDVMERLAKKYPIEVMLTGPARGYVKQRLEAAGIPYVHRILAKQKELNDFYNCLDLYLIASRVEGGPESLAESWATGTPLVSTRMGMPADFMIDGQNGLLADVDDVDKLAAACERIIADKKLAAKLTAKALEDVKKLDWKNLANEYNEKVYSKL